jgi:DNA-binding transcriptional ArsR family regulator
MHVRACNNTSISHGLDTDLSVLSLANARAVAETMHALATPSRVLILSRLSGGPCAVSELAQEIGMEQPAVSQQLRVLRHLGLVVGEREGRQVIYALHDEHVRALLTEAVSHTEHLRMGLSTRPAEQLAESPGKRLTVGSGQSRGVSARQPLGVR